MHSPRLKQSCLSLSATILCGLLLAGCSAATGPFAPPAQVTIPAPPAALAGDRDAVASHCLSWATRRTEERLQGLDDRRAIDVQRQQTGGLPGAVAENSALRDRDTLFRACMARHAPPAGPAPAA